MSQAITNRRVSRMANLDRNSVRELCDLHPLQMGQLCATVGLNKSAFSNFLTGRRHLPEKFAAPFLRQIGLTVRGEIDSRHCFYFAVGPGLEELASKWISKLFPSGGDMWNIVSEKLYQWGEDEVELDVEKLGVLLSSDDNMALVRDDVNFGNVSWIPGNWRNAGRLLSGKSSFNTTPLPTRDTVFLDMRRFSEPADPETSWAEVQDFAEKAGFTAREVMEYFENVLHHRALAKP